MERKILLKPLKLKEALDDYNDPAISQNRKNNIAKYFKKVWGNHIGSHFLDKYESAESLICKFDSQNLEKFINDF